MLNWLFPRPPLRVSDKAWIETRFAWLVQQLGERRLLDAQVIEPTDAFFPGAYDGTESDARMMYQRVCQWMQATPDAMRFEVVPADDMPGATGHYDRSDANQKPALRVADSQIDDPQGLVATLAHEIAHHILLGGDLLAGDESDHEWTTDLLPCVLGLGIFAANSTIRTAAGNSGTWSWWSIDRRGYMPSYCIGYALAIFAWLRGEKSPAWVRHLRLDAREPLTKGLRYLRRTGDCYVTRETLGTTGPRTTGELMQRLTTGSNSARIAALWDAEKHPSGASLAGHVQPLLRHRHAAVRSTAMRTAAKLRMNGADVVRELEMALGDSTAEVRAAAAFALGELLPDETRVVVDLGFALRDEAPEVVAAAATALVNYGERAEPAQKNLLLSLHDALIDCNYEMADLMIEVIRTALPDAGQAINDYFHQRDPEFRAAAIEALLGDGELES